MGNTLIFIGVLIILIGILFNIFGRFGLPLLPGDILVKRDDFTFYFPIVTSILLSLILTLIINVFKK